MAGFTTSNAYDYYKERATYLLKKKSKFKGDLLMIILKLDATYIPHDGKSYLLKRNLISIDNQIAIHAEEIKSKANSNLNDLISDLDKKESFDFFPRNSKNFKNAAIRHRDSAAYHLALLDILIADFNLIYEFNSQDKAEYSNEESTLDFLEFKSRTIIIGKIHTHQSENLVSSCLTKINSHLTYLSIQLSAFEYDQARKHGASIKATKLNKKEEQYIIDLLVRTLFNMNKNDYSSPLTEKVIPKHVLDFVKRNNLSGYDYYAICILELWELWPIFHISNEEQFIENITASLFNITKNKNKSSLDFYSSKNETPSISKETDKLVKEKLIWELGTKAFLKKKLTDQFSKVNDDQEKTINEATTAQCKIWLERSEKAKDINELLSLKL